jgi:ligand-binding sensor domain-containing protein
MSRPPPILIVATALTAALLWAGRSRAGWQTYSTPEGLTSNTVRVVFADRTGNLWFVTDAPGASMYDGVRWHYYRAADGLPSDTITTIAAGRDGALWFGTPRGVSRYDGVAWGPVAPIGGQGSSEVLAILEDHASRLWVGTPSGASRFDGAAWTDYTSANGLLANRVATIAEDRRGFVWFGTGERGVSRFDGNSWTTFGPLMSNGYDLGGTSICADSSGNVWFSGIYDYPWRFDGTNWRMFDINDGLSGALYRGPVFTDRSGAVWLSEWGHGASRFDGSHWRSFSGLNPEARDGLSGGDVVSITQDSDGNVWFGTKTDGVSRFDGSSWRVYQLWSTGSTLCQDCGLKDHLGNLWFAANGKILRYDGFGWQNWSDPTTMSYNLVNASLELANGKLWFGTFLGILEFDPVTHIATAGPVSGAVLALCQDRNGTLWVGTAQGLLHSNATGGFDALTVANTGGALPNDFVSDIVEDADGRLWISSFGSVVRYVPPGSASEIVDAGGDVGQYASLKLDGQGHPHFAYFDATYGVLKHAQGSTGAWTTETVDAAGTVGSYASLALDSSGNPCIAYFDETNGDLKFASRSGSTWGIETVDAAGFVGQFASLALDGQGNPRVAYYDAINGNLKYASRSGRVWTIATVDAAGVVGRYCSLALDSSGNPRIAYYDDSKADLKYASKSGSAWTLQTVDAVGNVGQYASLALDAQGVPQISYYGVSSSNLKYAIRGANGSWSSQIVNANLTAGLYTSLALDAQGSPRIAYYHQSTGDLEYASLAGGVWTSETVDVTGIVGLYASLVIDGQGLPRIAYYDQTNGNLKLATTRTTSWTLVHAAVDDSNRVFRMLRDHLGNIWLPQQTCLKRFDGTNWTTFVPDGGNFGTSYGIAGYYVNSIAEDSDGHIWVGTASRGAVRFDGTEWGIYSGVDGIQSSEVGGILQDTTGTIWFEGLGAVSGVDPDRRPPRTVVSLRPDAVTTNRSPAIGFGAAYNETYGILFSTSFNGGPWSPWSGEKLWTAQNLPDGPYELRIRSRDKIGNVDPTPETVAFEVDATPPVAQIDFPGSRQVVRDSIAIRGRAADGRFKRYRLEVRRAGAASWNPPVATVLADETIPVASGVIAGWNTRGVPDGDYEFRLTVADTVGLSGSAVVAVTVDNQFPSAELTSPALVREAIGGDVYTTNGGIHLHFPPHALDRDAIVGIADPGAAPAPDSIGPGVRLASEPFDLSLGGAAISKPGLIELSLRSAAIPDGWTPVLYRAGAGSAWSRLGGTMDGATQMLTAPLSADGSYALYAERSAPAGPSSVTALTLTPRVFSMHGAGSNGEVAIGFTLGSAASATVKIYNRAGRLVRTVADGQSFGPGANIVHWDGRDRDGSLTEDGLYLVTVESLGGRQTQALAVVR